MKHILTLLFITSISGLALGEVPSKVSQNESSAKISKAKMIAKNLIDETKSILIDKMGKVGAEGAVDVCSIKAKEIAGKLEKVGWGVKRVSLKASGKMDKPDAVENKVLKEWQKIAKDNLIPAEHFQTVVGKDGKSTLYYMTPITISSPVCLNCHGTKKEITPSVGKKIREIYPHDTARGYRLGDLRGAVSITIPLDAKLQDAEIQEEILPKAPKPPAQKSQINPPPPMPPTPAATKGQQQTAEKQSKPPTAVAQQPEAPKSTITPKPRSVPQPQKSPIALPPRQPSPLPQQQPNAQPAQPNVPDEEEDSDEEDDVVGEDD